MEFISFPIRVELSGQLARTVGGVPDSLLLLLQLMLRTPDKGWVGLPSFGVRDCLPKLPTDLNARVEVVKRMNETLGELGIEAVTVKTIQLDPASGIHESVYLLTVLRKGNDSETHQFRL
jgi:hypothetical protein